MSITKLLQESNQWLKDADKEFVVKKPPKQPEAVFEGFVKTREVEITARIATLEERRDLAIKRYDLAISAQKGELERLRKEVAPPKRDVPGNDKPKKARKSSQNLKKK